MLLAERDITRTIGGDTGSFSFGFRKKIDILPIDPLKEALRVRSLTEDPTRCYTPHRHNPRRAAGQCDHPVAGDVDKQLRMLFGHIVIDLSCLYSARALLEPQGEEVLFQNHVRRADPSPLL